MNRSFIYVFFGFVLGVTVTIASAYAWYEWFGGREYIKEQISQEVGKAVAGKIPKVVNPTNIVNPFSWFGK